jgi:hypothetical protein
VRKVTSRGLIGGVMESKWMGSVVNDVKGRMGVSLLRRLSHRKESLRLAFGLESLGVESMGVGGSGMREHR